MRWSSTSCAFAPGVHSHRDARRIGPNRTWGRTLARSCRFLRLSGSRKPCGICVPATSSANFRRRLVPSGGWLCSGELCRPAWRFQGRFEALSSGCLPLRAALPSVAGMIIRSALPWPCDRRVCIPFAHSRPHSDLPIAARLSLHLRFAGLCLATLPSVFSDAAAGIAAIPIGFEFFLLFQAVGPEREIGRAHV